MLQSEHGNKQAIRFEEKRKVLGRAGSFCTSPCCRNTATTSPLFSTLGEKISCSDAGVKSEDKLKGFQTWKEGPKSIAREIKNAF